MISRPSCGIERARVPKKMPIEVAKHVVKRTAKIASVAVKDVFTQK